MMYSKLFSSLVHSSLWSQMDHVRLLFITLLALADRDGIVYGSRAGLERASMIDLDMAAEHDPWEILMGPDNDSSDLMRNPENEGRRIEEVPGGFRIINYVYYRSLRDAEDRRVQNLEAQRRHRKKISSSQPSSAVVIRGNPIESKIETKKEKKKGGASGKPMPTVEDWLKKLEANPAYQGLNVRALHAKMVVWCEIRGLKPTLRRLVTWLNREDKPMPQHAARVDYKRNHAPPAREPTDEEFEKAQKIARREAQRFRDSLNRREDNHASQTQTKNGAEAESKTTTTN